MSELSPVVFSSKVYLSLSIHINIALHNEFYLFKKKERKNRSLSVCFENGLEYVNVTRQLWDCCHSKSIHPSFDWSIRVDPQLCQNISHAHTQSYTNMYVCEMTININYTEKQHAQQHTYRHLHAVASGAGCNYDWQWLSQSQCNVSVFIGSIFVTSQ